MVPEFQPFNVLYSLGIENRNNFSLLWRRNCELWGVQMSAWRKAVYAYTVLCLYFKKWLCVILGTGQLFFLTALFYSAYALRTVSFTLLKDGRGPAAFAGWVARASARSTGRAFEGRPRLTLVSACLRFPFLFHEEGKREADASECIPSSALWS